MSIILLIADDAAARSTMSSELERAGHFVWEVGGAAEARRHLSQWTPDLIINCMGDRDVLDLLAEVCRDRPHVRLLATPASEEPHPEPGQSVLADGEALNKTSQRTDKHLTIRWLGRAYN